MERINTDKITLRKFGFLMGAVFGIISLLLFIHHKQSIVTTLPLSIAFFVLGLVMPVILKPFFIIWMHFAFMLGWINTRLILVIIFYLLFTPISLIMRFFGLDPLELKVDKNKASYWKDREKKQSIASDYERQF